MRAVENCFLPLNEQALEKVETRLKQRDIAAFIMEPISINLGVLIATALQKIRHTEAPACGGFTGRRLKLRTLQSIIYA